MKQQHLNILLAEDDQDDHYLFELALKELKVSYKLTIVKDGAELMNYLSKHSDKLPDIIFLDLNMPGKNGFETIVDISEIEKLKAIPLVILTTSFTRDKDYEQGMIKQLFKLGADIFIRKPNSTEELKKLLSQALTLATDNTGMKYILNA